MLKLILASLLTTLALPTIAQVNTQGWTIADHWNATQLKFEQVIYGDINDVSCMKSEAFYLGCINALNAARDIKEPKIKHFLFPDTASMSPLAGFSETSINMEDPNLKEEEFKAAVTAYNQKVVNHYRQQAKLRSIKSPTTFAVATNQIKSEISGKQNEAHLTAIIYNAFLSSSYDPHTYIIPKSVMASEKQSSTVNKIYGIGYKPLDYQNQKKLMVLSALPNSPTEKAGIEPGDVIMDINGKTDPKEMADQFKQDTITITLEGSAGARTVTISRAEVKVAQLETKMIEDSQGRKFGYIKLKSFMAMTSCFELADAGEKFLTQRAEGIILDLRDNGGGLVSLAHCIMSLYLEPGSIMWVQKLIDPAAKNPVTIARLPNAFKLFSDIHTVTLINGYSASASEALASYLQAYRKSFIVGETSFGKGTMQAVTDFALNRAVEHAQTKAKFYGPHGVSNQLQGVDPDIVVYPTFGQEKATEAQREKDMYLNAIINAPIPVPVMPERVKQIALVKDCLKENDSIQEEVKLLDSFKLRVFDQQLSAAKSVIGCANDLRIPIFKSIAIPVVKEIK